MKLHSVKHPVLYEINTAVWLSALAARTGRPVTLGTVPEAEWDFLEGMDVDAVWLMGVWRRSEESRNRALELTELLREYERACPDWTPEDVFGSPYAVREYVPEPRFGDWKDLCIARQKLADRGIGLILDLVPNHTALDHPWVSGYPGFYVQGSAGKLQEQPGDYYAISNGSERLVIAHGRDPHFPPWTDTLQLNYWSRDLRREWKQTIHRLSTYCDGFRCDMAMLALNRVFGSIWKGAVRESEPTEFWEELLAEFHHLLWIAECYWDTHEELLNLGFDYVYDKGLLDCLRLSDHDLLYEHLRRIGSRTDRSVHFLENHDEPRSVVALTSLRPAALVAFAIPGMKLLHQGQMRGAEVRIPVQLGRARIESQHEGLRSYYEKLLREIKRAPLQEGDWSLCDSLSTSGRASPLFACQWSQRGEISRLLVVNLTRQRSSGRILLKGITSDRVYRFKECLGETVYRREGKELSEVGLHVILDPESFHFLEATTDTVLP